MNTLTLAEFQRMLAAYGADLQRWPAGVRENARSLLATSAEARELARGEAALDALLEQVAMPGLDPAFERRLNEIPLRAARRSRFQLSFLWAPALAWTLAAVCGVWLGSAYPEGQSSEEVAAGAALNDDALLELASGAFVELEDEQ
jgi:anti-sigma factor RsiW